MNIKQWLINNQIMKIKYLLCIDQMVTWEAPELPSSHKHSKHTAKPDPETSWKTTYLMDGKVSQSKWLGKAETHYHHKPHSWHSAK